MDATFEVVNPKIVTDDDAESENEVGVEDTEGKPDIEEAVSETGEDIEETKGSLQNADDGSAEKPKLFQGVSSKSVHVTLRNNFVPILISPRVTDIPIKVKLTMLAFAVIVLISIGISEYLREINKETACTSAPVPLDQNYEFCRPLYYRTPVYYGEDFDREATYSVRIETPEDFLFETMEISKAVDAIAAIGTIRDNAVLGSAIAYQNLIEDQTDPGEPLDFISDVSVSTVDLFGTVFDDDEFEGFLDDDDDEFDLDDLGRNNSLSSLVPVLSISYSTDSGVLCQYDALFTFDILEPVGISIWKCENGGTYSLSLSPDEEEYDVIGEFQEILRQFHLPLDAEGSLDSILRSTLEYKQTYCCDTLIQERVEIYGLTLGFGFALEGVITFFLALSLFRGKLGLRKAEFKTKNIEKRQISRSDIRRIIFNPRCHTIPFASTISVFSLLTVTLASVSLGFYLQAAKETTICESVVVNDLQKKLDLGADCNTETFFETFIFTASEVGSFTTNAFYAASTALLKNQDLLFLTDQQKTEIETMCNQTFTAPFLNDSASCFAQGSSSIFPMVRSSTELIDNDDDEAEITIVEQYLCNSTTQSKCILTYVESIGGTVNLLDEFEENGEYALELNIRYEDIFGLEYEVIGHISSSDFLTPSFNSKNHSRHIMETFIKAALDEELSAPFISTPLRTAFYRCCRDFSLSAFEYIGLSFGYITLAEGFITFIVAYFGYQVLNISSLLFSAVGPM
eukprot:CAMPEP_0184026718 /NCGR_PEP_ID=MMETSP0954-20121128/13709_1 /TAXON_ID=627963 /ORGANISM="Aplanochytrium sp, Strain PBS07" /LENGTH=741 /DNA_ID=CAMNT_0026311019 /DNA_START=126 /DNA_END=2351 /DNA_ORIENTATION=-